MARIERGSFFTVDVSVAALATLRGDLVGGADFVSRPVDVTSCESIALTIEVEAENAAASGVISVDFVVANQGSLFDTANNISQVFATIELTMTTNSKERTSRILGVEGLSMIGVGRIRNSDAAFAADVQVYFGKYSRITAG